MKRHIWILLVLLVVISLVAAQCGGDVEEPPADVKETEETAAEEEEPVVEETEEPAAEPTEEVKEEEPAPVSAEGGTYSHPSGKFTIKQFGEVVSEDPEGAIFSDGKSLVLVFFGDSGKLSVDALESTAKPLLDSLVSEGVLSSYTAYYDEPEEANNGYVVYFDFESTEWGEGESALFITQSGDTGYAVVYLGSDLEAKWDAWEEVVMSFTPGEGGAVTAEEKKEEEVKEGEGGGEAAAPITAAGGASSGEYTYDTGFRPEANGFPFSNYGDEIGATNLTPAEMQRMFGDVVCANTAGGCTLTPPVQRWMQQYNQYMAGGHCEGLAVLSLLIYYNQSDPSDFGAGKIQSLDIMGNELLQREIAYWWTTQGTYPAWTMSIEGPSKCVDALIETYSAGGTTESWSVGIFQENGEGGHAVTPFAVQDMGGGIYHVMVYDNNYPNETRFIKVDKNTDTFEYEAAINPQVESELYTGKGMMITPTSGRLQKQECEPCAAGAETRRYIPGLAASEQKFIEVWLDGDSDLLITDSKGNKIGWVGDEEFVNEIPGARVHNFFFSEGVDTYENEYEPLYYLPADIGDFSITVDGTWMETEEGWSDVTMIGPGYNLLVEDIWLGKGEKDTIVVAVLGDRHYELTYVTDYTDSPDVIVGIETEEADWEFLVAGAEIDSGEFNVELDFAEGDFTINTIESEAEQASVFEFYILRIDDEDEYVYGSENLELPPESIVYLNFKEWDGDGSIYLDFDDGYDGTIDRTVELEHDDELYEMYMEWVEEGVEEDEE